MIAKLIVFDWRATIAWNKFAYLFYPFFVFIVGFATSQMLVIPMSLWIALSYSTNPFFAEEKGELNNLLLTLPIKRSQIVTARYVYSLFLMLVGIIVGIAIMPIVRHFSRSQWFIGVEGHIAVIAVSVLVFAIFNLFMFPALFKLGYQKGKIWGIYMPAMVFGALYMAFYIYMMVSERNVIMDSIRFASDNMLLVSGGMGTLAVMILLLSYMLSLRLYSRRNF